MTAEAMKLCNPATIHSRSTECHNQDKVSMGTIAARDARTIVEIAQNIAAIHLIAACQALELRGIDEASAAARAAFDLVRERVPFLDGDRRMDRDIRAVVELIAYRGALDPCTNGVRCGPGRPVAASSRSPAARVSAAGEREAGPLGAAGDRADELASPLERLLGLRWRARVAPAKHYYERIGVRPAERGQRRYGRRRHQTPRDPRHRQARRFTLDETRTLAPTPGPAFGPSRARGSTISEVDALVARAEAMRAVAAQRHRLLLHNHRRLRTLRHRRTRGAPPPLAITQGAPTR